MQLTRIKGNPVSTENTLGTGLGCLQRGSQDHVLKQQPGTMRLGHRSAMEKNSLKACNEIPCRNARANVVLVFPVLRGFDLAAFWFGCVCGGKREVAVQCVWYVHKTALQARIAYRYVVEL